MVSSKGSRRPNATVDVGGVAVGGGLSAGSVILVANVVTVTCSVLHNYERTPDGPTSRIYYKDDIQRYYDKVIGAVFKSSKMSVPIRMRK